MNPLDAERASLNNLSGRRAAPDLERPKPPRSLGKPLDEVRKTSSSSSSDVAPSN